MSEGEQEAVKQGLRRVAMDLHTHTPASQDWEGGEIDPEAYVQAAIDAGLAAVAVTDHQTGDWIDKVKAAAASTDLVIFPGVEINNLAGVDGIHLVALFDTDTTTKDIDRFLAAIGVVGGAGRDRRRETTSEGIVEVLDKIGKWGGIAVLAHCQSSKGVLSEMRGAVRTAAIQHPAVLAAEAPAADYFDEGKKANRKRTFDLLDGKDPDYQRELAVFQSSDNPIEGGGGHCLEGIGKRFTYFYVDDPINLESLRQCFIDREVRIQFPAAEEEKPVAESRLGFPRISRLDVVGGFLDGLKLDLHSGLTTLIGAKGSGKSLLVELIRFALDQPPTQAEIRRDHEAKLEKRLGHYGKVTVGLVDASGTEHTISRVFDPANQSPYDDGAPIDVAEFFPCHLLSQSEIVRLAESETEQINFIDSFFDFRAHRRAIEETKRQLAELDKQVAVQIRARKATDALLKEAETLAKRIETIDRQLKDPVFAEYRAALQKKQSIDDAIASISELGSQVGVATTTAESVALPSPSEPVADDPLVKRLTEQAGLAKQAVIDAYGKGSDEVRTALKAATEERDAWLPDFKKIEEAYNDKVQASGGDVAKLSQERGRLVNAKNSADSKLRDARTQAEQLTPTVARRTEMVKSLKEQEEAYTKERQDRCGWFEEKSDKKIRAKVDPGSNYEGFHERLEEMKRGSYLPGDEVEQIAKSVKPAELVRTILRYDLSQKETDLDGIGNKAGLGSDRIARLADFLLGDLQYEDLLALEYSVTPTDRPEISYRLPGGTYAKLEELSTGQKCTAFLIMMLCEGSIPIIVDQPEDSLDIRSIWEDMCKRLRISKRSRQFVFTTHNSSLSVASDTDKFVVLAGDGRHGDIVMSGAIDSERVRKDVIELLEGGEDTYFLKQRKYNLQAREPSSATEDGAEDAVG